MRSKTIRNERIEFLRVCAIVGISTFHVLLAWFQQACELGPIHPSIVDSHAQLLASSLPSMWLMSLINLLGAWGNHVFYMISGFFLISSLAAQSTQAGFWHRQCFATLRRCTIIVLTLAFYGGIALFVNAYVMALPGIGDSAWFGINLEFIWLYLIFVALAPAIAWVIERIASFKVEIALAALLVMVYLINGYIAFIDQGNIEGRGLGDWRKQMSAVTYLLSFVCAGVIGTVVRQTHAIINDSKLHTMVKYEKLPQVLRATTLVAAIVVVVLTGIMAAFGQYHFLYALSFKSTSIISFVFALLALLLCVIPKQHAKAKESGMARYVATINMLAPGIVGFYIAQSLMHALWYTASYLLMHTLLGQAAQHGAISQATALSAFFVCGIIFAIMFAVLVCVFDRFTRQPVMRLLKLGH